MAARPIVECVVKVGPWGREAWWSDRCFRIPTNGNFRRIKVCHGRFIHSITFTIQDANGHEQDVKFGGNGGECHIVEFASGQYITSISGAYGYWSERGGIYITAIQFKTNLGNEYGPYGQEADQPGVTTETVKFSSPPLENTEINGFCARFDDYIQNIGIYVKPAPGA